ncbi:hypothetical protein D3C86_1115740 [compost metagenome]
MGRLHHDGGHGGLDPIEESGHNGHFAEGDVHPRQSDQDEQRGQHKQHASNHPAPGSMHQPTDIGCQLLSLWPRKQHAVVEGMQESALGYPAPPLHQFLVHDRDLSGWPAEADEAELQPEPERFTKTDRFRPRQFFFNHWCQNLTHWVVPLLQTRRAGRRRWRSRQPADGRRG